MKPSRLVALFPAHWRERYGKEFSALLEELPVSPSVILDVLVAAIGARLSYVRRRFTGEVRTHGTGTVARLARLAMLTVLIVTPVATGAVGYYLGRSQISRVAEPTSFPALSNPELQQLIRQPQTNPAVDVQELIRQQKANQELQQLIRQRQQFRSFDTGT